MDLGLQNARVLVTAASGGLGAATARQFSREGARVVINSRHLDSLQDTAASITDETGNLVFTHAADVTDIDAVEKLVANTASMLGGLDILVTNAGGPPAGSFEDFDMAAWRDATDLTLLSAVNLVRCALPHLKQSSRAAVLAIASIAAKQPVDNLILSNAIRPAVVGLMNSLSQEFGSDGIRVNSLLPGVTETQRVDQLMQARANKNNTTPQDEREQTARSIPLQRLGNAAEFANTAVFVCSPAGGFINGVALPVDGGAIRTTL